MSNTRLIKEFSVKEFHRGEWVQVFAKDNGKKTPKKVKISIEHAELLSNDALAQVKEKKATSMFIYVLEQKQQAGAIPKMKRQDMMKFCKENNIEFAFKDKNEDLEAKINEFKKSQDETQS